jgi:hypothetical protein
MTNSNQMDLFPTQKKSTSSQVAIPASLSVSQVEKKVKKIRDTSGQSILDLSENSGPIGLLEKTLLGILNSVSTPYLRTWRVKVTPQGRLVFQLRASVRTTKGKESGLLLTPNAMDSLPPRSEEALKKQYQNNRKGRTTHSTLREQVVYPSPQKMWRTPDNMKGGSNLPGIKKALDEGHLKRPSGQPMQIRLQDQVKEKRLWPTPTTDSATNRTKKYKQGGTPLTVAVQRWPTPTANEDAAGRPGGKMQKMLGNHPEVRKPLGGGTLNPTWVEWLMGYPKGWTDLNHSETVLFHKSPTTSDSVSSNRIFWRTPTAEGDGGQRGLGKMTSEEARKKNRTVSLSRQVRDSLMWPTPTATDGRRGEIHEDGTVKKSWKKRRDKWAAKGVNLHRPLDIVVALDEEKKIWRTPTAMDGGDNAEKYAARILKGKNKRSSKHKVQETLSMQVAAENLKNNPKRVDELLEDEMTARPDLPAQKDFVEFMYSQTTPKKLSEQSGIDYTTVEHWFRKGKYFSYPSIKDWNHIKQFLQEIKYDKEMNTIKTIEWEND